MSASSTCKGCFFARPPACHGRRETTRRLGVAWLLASACLLHHLTHWLGSAAPHWLHVLSSTPVHAAMSALALLGEPPAYAAAPRVRAVSPPLMLWATLCRSRGAVGRITGCKVSLHPARIFPSA